MVKVIKEKFVVIEKKAQHQKAKDSFKPWENGFSKGLYLAGVECIDNAEAPDGWIKWTIPSYEYIVVENHNGAFEDTIKQMNEEGMSLVGAVHDYTDPATGKGYMYFPIREI